MANETQTECPMSTKPQAEHEWLHRMVGEWTFEVECIMGPDQPPMKSSGVERVRSIGGLWVVAEGQGQAPDGSDATSMMTLGYDTRSGRFVGTFIASMMDYLWLYEAGERDAAGRTLTLPAKGPNMAPGKEGELASYRDVIEFVSDDHRVMRSYVLGDDGQWTQIVTANYRRTK